jgi:tRNA nucleotidyltransferase/poly(A) polymerase
MDASWELYDKNNKDHNDTSKYEVMEYSNENDTDGRHPSSVECGDIMSDAQRR